MPSESMETRISHVFENGPYTSRILIFQTFGTWAIFKKVTTLTRVKLGNRNVLKRIFFHLHQKPTYERALKTRWSIFAAFFHFSHTMLYWGGLFNALNIQKVNIHGGETCIKHYLKRIPFILRSIKNTQFDLFR